MVKENEAIEEASRCLSCKHRPCSNACPVKTEIPEFIAKIKDKNYKDAYEILIKNNPFSHICSIVCPQEQQCEGGCVHRIKSKAISIGKLEKFINEWAVGAYGIRPEQTNEMFANVGVGFHARPDKKVAIIGAGPAGITCAMFLARSGIEVTIFEKESEIGGILKYGIPDFRLNKSLIDETLTKLKKLNVTIEYSQELGKDITVVGLKEQFDAVFVGIGAEVSTTYKLSDNEIENVFDSSVFLKDYSTGNTHNNLGDVVVIGGGNVAMDCARAAKRSGADTVKIVYRRAREHMPATDKEVEDTINDGVEFIYLTRVIGADSEDGKMTEIHCIKTEIQNNKAVDIDGAEFNMSANTVIFAIGLSPNKKILEQENIAIENGIVKLDEHGQTNIDGVFAGGDVSNYKSTVCYAIAEGKHAAESIINYLRFE